MKTFKPKVKSLAVLLIILQFWGCASEHNQISGSQSVSGDTANEVALGKQIHELIVSRIPVCPNEEVDRYVQSIGRQIARYAKRQEIPYEFIVLQDDRMYATSSPGGFVYITSGFLLFLKNEAELAFILAHEIGELQRKDPRLSHTRKIVEQLMKTGATVAPAFGGIGALAMLGVFGVYAMTNNDISKEERIYNADAKALEMMVNSGYDPQGAFNVFYNIANASSKELMYFYDYYQARPVTTARLARLERKFAQLDLSGKSFDMDRSHYMKMIEPLKSSQAV